MMNEGTDHNDPLAEVFARPEVSADDTGQALRAALLSHYNLVELEGTGNGIPLIDYCRDLDIAEVRGSLIDLLNDSLWYAADTLRSGSRRFGPEGIYRPMHLDDSGDYDNAAASQIGWILEAFQSAPEGDEIFFTYVMKALNLDDDDSCTDNEAYAFKLGWADHFTPISHLSRMNQGE